MIRLVRGKIGKSLGLIGIAYATFGLATASLSAQHPDCLRQPEPAVILSQIAAGGGGTGYVLRAFRTLREDEQLRVFGCYDHYSDAARQEVLDGLERIAGGRTTVKGPEAMRAMRDAFFALAMIGLDPDIVAPEATEIPGRMLRIYQAANHNQARVMALHRLGDLLALNPPETPLILELLTELASIPLLPGEGYHSEVPLGHPDPHVAVIALLRGCSVGVPVLTKLSRDGMVGRVEGPQSHPKSEVAQWVESLAQRGFPREEMVAARGGIPCP